MTALTTMVFASPGGADVTQVGGGAFGFRASIGLFGGPAQNRGPAPSVTLPAGGSATPITATEPSGTAQFGPAVIFQSGQLRVSTQGTTGADGTVTSSATITGGTPDAPGPVLYDEVSSTCTAKESGATGSATIRGGKLETKYDANTEEPITTENIPANPPPNFERTGSLDHIGDNYRVVYNEQIRETGGITVNAVHMYMLGPTAARGDLIIGQVRCSTNASGGGSGPGSGAGSGSGSDAGSGSGSGSGSAPGSGSGSGGSGGSGGSSGGGSGMPNTGTDILPLVLVGSELVAGGAAAVVWASRRRAWPRR